MGGSHRGSRYNVPFDTVPRLGQVPEDFAEIAEAKKPRDILQERDSWSHLAYDPDGVRPQVAPVRLGLPLPGRAERLAWEPAADDVDEAPPGPPIEPADVPEHREPGEASFAHPPCERPPAMPVDLDRADRPMPKEDIAEDSAASPRKKVHSSGTVQFAKFDFSLFIHSHRLLLWNPSPRPNATFPQRNHPA